MQCLLQGLLQALAGPKWRMVCPGDPSPTLIQATTATPQGRWALFVFPARLFAKCLNHVAPVLCIHAPKSSKHTKATVVNRTKSPRRKPSELLALRTSQLPNHVSLDRSSEYTAEPLHRPPGRRSVKNSVTNQPSPSCHLPTAQITYHGLTQSTILKGLSC